MDIVIGSGPSGIAVAHALLARGRKVTMVDPCETFAAAAGVGLGASHAVGGVSQVWGGAVLPSRAADLVGWPDAAAHLAPHYKAVAEIMPIAAADGALDEVFAEFELHRAATLPVSSFAQELERRVARKRAALAARGVRAGRAVGLATGEDGCQPAVAVSRGDHPLGVLRTHDGFTYRSPAPVTHLSEAAAGVQVHLDDGSAIEGDALFVAAGVMETARLVLSSFPMLGPSLLLKNSQHIFTPMICAWALEESEAEQGFAEIFFEMDAPRISRGLIHTQISRADEAAQRAIMAKVRPVPGMARAARWLADRLVLAQSFVHSDHGGQIAVSLAPDGRLKADCLPNPKARKVLAAARRRLILHLSGLGLFAVPFAGRRGTPGSGVQIGGSLPMAEAPRRGQTDVAGRLEGTMRVHVVDASVLPSIPATPITFSVMANAHRIGSIAP